MPYNLVQLAAGAYDIEYDGDIVASLVVTPGRTDIGRWTAELLRADAPTPAPFAAPVHTFRTFSEVLNWLGDPNVAYPHEVTPAQRAA